MATRQQRFAKRAKRLRLQIGLTQEKVAKKTGLTREYIARLEQGIHDPSLSVLVKLTKVLKVKIEKLIA
jgi:transcriptional regulator with XRE-family HTH domain